MRGALLAVLAALAVWAQPASCDAGGAPRDSFYLASTNATLIETLQNHYTPTPVGTAQLDFQPFSNNSESTVSDLVISSVTDDVLHTFADNFSSTAIDIDFQAFFKNTSTLLVYEEVNQTLVQNFSDSSTIQSRKYDVQVAPVLTIQETHGRDATWAPVPGRPAASEPAALYDRGRVRLHPSHLTNNERDLELLDKLRLHAAGIENQTSPTVFQVPKRSEASFTEATDKQDLEPQILSSELTTEKSVKSKSKDNSVSDEMSSSDSSGQVSDDVRFFKQTIDHIMSPDTPYDPAKGNSRELSDEIHYFNQSFEDTVFPGPTADQQPRISEFSHDLLPGNSDPVLHSSGSSEGASDSDYSGEASLRQERQEFASSLKALLRVTRNATHATHGAHTAAGAAPAERDVDLVLSGERALVQLWPQFGDLLERLLDLASETCKRIPLVSMIAQQQTAAPRLRVLAYTERGRRELRAGQERDAAGLAPGMLVLYVPGWWNTPHDAAARALRAALVPAAGALLLLDTRAAFCRPYLSAAARVPRVAEYLAGWLRRSAVPPARLHIVGFSLGAHVAAQAAVQLRRAGGGRVARVSALEPAGPCLAADGWRHGARHVQVVHTSRSLALAGAAGHADVWARAAAGCAPGCQHAAAWRLFAASARDPGVLRAPRCRGPRELAAAACSGAEAALGYPCSRRARGLFLLEPPRHLVAGLD